MADRSRQRRSRRAQRPGSEPVRSYPVLPAVPASWLIFPIEGEHPETKFWASEDEWDLIADAPLLLLNIEPRTGLGLYFRQRLRDGYAAAGIDLTPGDDAQGLFASARPPVLGSPPACRNARDANVVFAVAKDIARRALIAHTKGVLAVRYVVLTERGKAHPVAEARLFLTWARDRGWDVPAKLGPIAGSPSRARAPFTDAMLMAMQEIYDQLDRPSQRSVAERLGCSRNSQQFRDAWSKLKKR